jgi:hypothetical protein
MVGLDAFHLARAQFAFTVMFHIVFPALSIGLASYLMVLGGLRQNPQLRLRRKPQCWKGCGCAPDARSISTCFATG